MLDLKIRTNQLFSSNFSIYCRKMTRNDRKIINSYEFLRTLPNLRSPAVSFEPVTVSKKKKKNKCTDLRIITVNAKHTVCRCVNDGIVTRGPRNSCK